MSAASPAAWGEEPGWVGTFTRAEHPGAWPNGTRIIKGECGPGDATPPGTPGVVLGSIADPAVMAGAICYFVEWAARPRMAVACVAWKLRRADA